MKKLAYMVFLIAVLFVFATQSFGADIYGCKKKVNGQLRVVNSEADCLPSEEFIVLGGGGNTGTMGKLLCVTGELRYTPQDTLPLNYCTEDPVTSIVKEVPDGIIFDDVFEVICATENPVQVGGHEYNVLEGDEVFWGLRCREENGWENTGCGSSNYETSDSDLVMALNGCFSDDEEYVYGNIFATCCKVVAP